MIDTVPIYKGLTVQTKDIDTGAWQGPFYVTSWGLETNDKNESAVIVYLLTLDGRLRWRRLSRLRTLDGRAVVESTAG